MPPARSPGPRPAARHTDDATDDAPTGSAAEDDEPTRVLRRTPPPTWLTEDDDDPAGDAGAGSLVPAGRTGEVRRPVADDSEADGTDADGTAAAAGAAVVGAMSQVGTRVTALARRAVDKVTELSPDTEREETVDDDLDRPAPLVPSEPLTNDESKLALGIIVTFLVLALVVGIYGVKQIGANTDLGLDATPTPTAGATSASPSGSSTGTGRHRRGEHGRAAGHPQGRGLRPAR